MRSRSFLAVSALSLVAICVTSCIEVATEEIGRKTDPTNHVDVVTFTRDAGATTGFGWNLALVSKGSDFGDDDIVLTTYHGAPDDWKWDAGSLLITCPKDIVIRSKDKINVDGKDYPVKFHWTQKTDQK